MQQQQQQQGAGAHEAEFGGGGGGKATRRKGRDMERALARGDLGALGAEVSTGERKKRSTGPNRGNCWLPKHPLPLHAFQASATKCRASPAG